MIGENTRVPSEHDPETAERLVAGRYRLRSPLGHGAMGTVWAAFDEFLRRSVAVKEVRLPPGLPELEAEQLKERALREARAIAALTHPNVITLHDVIQQDGAPFVVMERFPGVSLAELLARHGPLTAGQAATVGDALAAALEAAHAAGITHRDVKPGNVLVSADGLVKLTDFGIARSVSELTMTASGIMLGSPAYMAPEVASGKRATPSADMWSLGATLFAAVEGRPPYDAEGDPLKTVDAVIHDEVPQPSPGPLAELISTLMTKDPDARPLPADVRRTLHDLRAEPGPLFPSALFDDLLPEDVGGKANEKAGGNASGNAGGNADENTGDDDAGSAVSVAGNSLEAREQSDGAGDPAPLADDPGPLPFAVTEAAEREAVEEMSTALPQPRRRSRLTTAGLGLAAVLLFVATLAGGFAASRVLAGEPVLPPPPRPTPERAQPPATATYAKAMPRTDNASMLVGEPPAQFTIDVPVDWTKFVTQQSLGHLPTSTLIEYVSPDGSKVLSVERFPEFFAEPLDGTFDEYVDAVVSMWPEGDVVVVQYETERTRGRLTYRTVDSGSTTDDAPDTRIARTTFVALNRLDSDLWVVSVTVPAEEERAGRVQLFERLAKTFAAQ